MSRYKKATLILAGTLSALMLGSCRNAKEEEYNPGADTLPRFAVTGEQSISSLRDAMTIYDTVTGREYLIVASTNGISVTLMPEWDREQTNEQVKMTSGQIHYGWTKNLHFTEDDLHEYF